jgi:hypothetical protein
MSPIAFQSSTGRPPSNDLRLFVKQNSEEKFKENYYERKQTLENQLCSLAEEKKQLSFELSRIPKTGAKSLKRQGELENHLDEIDRQMASTRREMRQSGVL